MPAEKHDTNVLRGLTSAEVARRLIQHGPNQLTGAKKVHPFFIFLSKFKSPLLIILITVSIISFFIGESINAGILIIMVLFSALLEFVNSYKSQKAVEALASRVVTLATVVRNGKQQNIPLAHIVPDDIIMLSAGNVVPADAMVLSSDDFFVNQSALTGESFPVEKVASKTASIKDATPSNQSMVFMGTNTVSGFATVRVLHTGRATAFGAIADRLSRREVETDFEKQSRRFSIFIMRITIVFVGIVFALNAFAGHGWFEAFVFSIAIAVGLTPELLPVIISISLSHGSIKMAKQGVIVKNLNSIQNFGSMTILCTDKTGTLTKDQIEVVKYMDPLGKEAENVFLFSYLNSKYRTGVPNPLDAAIKKFKSIATGQYKKIDEIPFDFTRKRQSVVVEHGGDRLLISKGAPEALFDICTTYQSGKVSKALHGPARTTVTKQYNDLSSDGYRVLAVATTPIHDKRTVYEPTDEKAMTLIGFIAFLDPPKNSAATTIHELEDMGIEVKILTGDSELLTEKICRELNIAIRGITTGDAVSRMSDEQLLAIVPNTTIFARISPEQKERIIINIKKLGSAVGYLGDGINDAPALKAADVGISVNNAVDVARDTADMILLQKSLRVVKDGVIEGRKTFHNSMKYIKMGLSSNFGNMFSMMVASAFLPFLPMLPTQILLNNLMYDISQLTLTTDHVDPDEIKKPTRWDFAFIRRYMVVFGIVSSVFDFITFWLLISVFRLSEHGFQAGWFIESLATQVIVIYIIRTKKIPFFQSSPSKLLLFNTLLVVVVGWLIPFSLFSGVLQLSPLPLTVLLAIASTVIVYLLVVEVTKQWFYRRELRLAVK